MEYLKFTILTPYYTGWFLITVMIFVSFTTVYLKDQQYNMSELKFLPNVFSTFNDVNETNGNQTNENGNYTCGNYTGGNQTNQNKTYVGSIGHFIDNDNDGTYKSFYSNSTNNVTSIKSQNDMDYLQMWCNVRIVL